MADGPSLTSSLKQKESAFRTVFTLGLLGAGGVGLYFVLPFVAIILTNLLYCGLLALVLAAFAYMLLDKQMRTIAWVLYRNMTHWMADAVVGIDPIGVMETIVEEKKERSAHLGEQYNSLTAQMKLVSNQIRSNAKEAEQSQAMANQARNKPDLRAVFMLHSAQYDRLTASNVQLQEMYDRYGRVQISLKRAKEYSEFVIADAENSIKVQKSQKNLMKAGYSVYEQAHAIISGTSAGDEMWDLANEKLTTDLETKFATIDNFADESKGLFDSFDLKNEAAAAKMIERLDALEKKGNDIVQPPRVALRVAKSAADDASPDSMDDLFTEKKKSARR